jgi:membrane protein DedA with SNARE-associated domain
LVLSRVFAVFPVCGFACFFRKFLILGWMIQPNTRANKKMANKNVIYIAAVVIIVIIVSSSLIYINIKTSSQNAAKR